MRPGGRLAGGNFAPGGGGGITPPGGGGGSAIPAFFIISAIAAKSGRGPLGSMGKGKGRGGGGAAPTPGMMGGGRGITPPEPGSGTRPGIPGNPGADFRGIFWSTSPSASSSCSCSSSSCRIWRPPRRSQVPWASAAASPMWYRSLKESASPGLERDQNLVILSLEPDAKM